MNIGTWKNMSISLIQRSKQVFRLGIALIFLIAMQPEPAHAATGDPRLAWYTYFGSKSFEETLGAAVDASGNVYVTGISGETWGNPIHAFAGGDEDAYVAKFDSNGTLLWNTFLGSGDFDGGYGITVDTKGNVYLTGFSFATWGSPIDAFASGPCHAFVAKLNSDGKRLWNTFLGGPSYDGGTGISIDVDGYIYVVGSSDAVWGHPVRAFAGEENTFIAKLNSDGKRLWNTFSGSNYLDRGVKIALDSEKNIYITGISWASWGHPIQAFAGGFEDAFVAKFNKNGKLLWNTFLGSGSIDEGNGIAIDGWGKIYVTGISTATWGSPLNAFDGGCNTFVARFDSDGRRLWHTFLGSGVNVNSTGIDVDGSGNVYVTGYSDGTWGNPVRPYSRYDDAFVVKFDSNGKSLWNTFLGGPSEEFGYDIVVDGRSDVYVVGEGIYSWGDTLPTNPAAGNWDGFVAKLSNPKESLPSTGFAQGQITSLPAQPEDRVYSNLAMRLEIPRLGVNKEIVGVPRQDVWDVTWLGDKAGYLEGSAFPTWSGNTVLTGHVWDTQNRPGPFAGLKTLKYGDAVNIRAFGQVYTYEVRENLQIDPNDVAQVMKHEDYSWVTLVTCESYDAKDGTYTARRMVRAVLIKVE